MKFVKLVDELLRRAERNGTSRYVRNGIPTYNAEMNENEVVLYHYDTELIRLDCRTEKIIYLYGESISDVDAISTFSYRYGLHLIVGYRPVHGGFYAYDTDGKEIRLDAFVKEYGEAHPERQYEYANIYAAFGEAISGYKEPENIEEPLPVLVRE